MLRFMTCVDFRNLGFRSTTLHQIVVVLYERQFLFCRTQAAMLIMVESMCMLALFSTIYKRMLCFACSSVFLKTQLLVKPAGAAKLLAAVKEIEKEKVLRLASSRLLPINTDFWIVVSFNDLLNTVYTCRNSAESCMSANITVVT